MRTKAFNCLVGLIVFTFPTICTNAQNALTRRVDRYVHAEMQKEHIPGLSLGDERRASGACEELWAGKCGTKRARQVGNDLQSGSMGNSLPPWPL